MDGTFRESGLRSTAPQRVGEWGQLCGGGAWSSSGRPRACQAWGTCPSPPSCLAEKSRELGGVGAAGACELDSGGPGPWPGVREWAVSLSWGPAALSYFVFCLPGGLEGVGDGEEEPGRGSSQPGQRSAPQEAARRRADGSLGTAFSTGIPDRGRRSRKPGCWGRACGQELWMAAFSRPAECPACPPPPVPQEAPSAGTPPGRLSVSSVLPQSCGCWPRGLPRPVGGAALCPCGLGQPQCDREPRACVSPRSHVSVSGLPRRLRC